jgi:two-component system response regulator AtoC
MMSLEKILVVDDDINLCRILTEELSDVGYQTHYITGGSEALEYLNNNSVDLLLLDLNMPGVDGFDVLQELSKKETKPKVIVLTAYADVKSAIESAKLGANDFLSKPYDFDELLITIRKVLQSD